MNRWHSERARCRSAAAAEGRILARGRIVPRRRFSSSRRFRREESECRILAYAAIDRMRIRDSGFGRGRRLLRREARARRPRRHVHRARRAPRGDSASAACRSAARCSVTSRFGRRPKKTRPGSARSTWCLLAVKAYDNASALPRCADARPRHDGADAAERRRQRPRGRRGGRRGRGDRRHHLHRDRARRARRDRADRHAPPDRVRRGVRRAAARVRARRAIREALPGADIQAEAVGDGRVPIWEKFIFLVSLAGFTGAARLPIGPIWADPVVPRAVPRRAAARSSGCARRKACRSPPTSSSGSRPTSPASRVDAVVAADRSVAGQADRGRGAAGSGGAAGGAAGVPVPIMSTLYAVLKPWASPTRVSSARSRVAAQLRSVGSTAMKTGRPAARRRRLEMIERLVGVAELQVARRRTVVDQAGAVAAARISVEPLRQ